MVIEKLDSSRLSYSFVAKLLLMSFSRKISKSKYLTDDSDSVISFILSSRGSIDQVDLRIEVIIVNK